MHNHTICFIVLKEHITKSLPSSLSLYFFLVKIPLFFLFLFLFFCNFYLHLHHLDSNRSAGSGRTSPVTYILYAL